MDTLIAFSDEFEIVQDSSDFVHIMDGEQTIRLSMPRKILDDIVSQIHSRVDYHF
jgi:hypothetical protein